MLAVPFVYFLILFIYIYKKRGLSSVATLLIGIYMLISFGSILIDRANAYSEICPKVNIEIYSPILYCGLLTICFSPFVKFHDEKINNLKPLRKTYIINGTIYFFFVLFVVFLLLTYNDLIKNIALIQINDNLKADFRFGREDVVSLTGFSKTIYNWIRYFSSSSMYLLFFFFYSLCFQKRSICFYIITLLASSTCIIDSLLHLDRSGIMYWFMDFLLFGVFFLRFMSAKARKTIFVVLIALIVLGISYFTFMNLARFGNSVDNTNNQLLSYFGQSYINFCNFLQNLDLKTYSIVNTLPLTNHILYPDFLSEDWYNMVRLRSGINIMVFSTFLGDIMSGVGQFWMIVYVIIFTFLSNLCLTKTRYANMSLHKLFLFFMLINTVYLGLFANFYHIWTREVCAVLLYIVIYYADSAPLRNNMVNKNGKLV